jgi:signal transduction histidine kinase
MSPEQVSKACDRFWRADPSRTAKSGVGLGLAICQSIANLHHGKIEIDSQLGVGTCLTVILPVKIGK